jgi:hypothetical protein
LNADVKRTLLAVSVAVLLSLMWIPTLTGYTGSDRITGSGQPFFALTGYIQWDKFVLQTIFAAIVAAVIVNLFPRRSK